MVFNLKQICQKMIEDRENALIKRFFESYNRDNITVYGPEDIGSRVGIFSFNIRHNDRLIHQNLIVQLFNDIFGI